MIVGVQVGLTKPGSVLAYNAPASVGIGDTVVLPPLPWQDPDGANYGTVVGLLDDYEGWIKPIRSVVPAEEAAALRDRLAQAHAAWEAERQSEREAEAHKGEICALAATKHFNIQAGRYLCYGQDCNYRQQRQHTHKCRVSGHPPYDHAHTAEELMTAPALPRCAANPCPAEGWRVLNFPSGQGLYARTDWRHGTVQVCGMHVRHRDQSYETMLTGGDE